MFEVVAGVEQRVVGLSRGDLWGFGRARSVGCGTAFGTAVGRIGYVDVWVGAALGDTEGSDRAGVGRASRVCATFGAASGCWVGLGRGLGWIGLG